jgi:hypothetical protein
MMPPLSMKQLDQLAPIIPTKGWNVRSLALLGQAEGPEASTEIRPPDLWLLALLPCLFICLKNTPGTSSYSTSQACQPVPSGDHR